jgi:hypothetical protein
VGHPQDSSHWLSLDMAHALAAMYPPLQPTNVAKAADKLTAGTEKRYVLNDLLRQGVDLMNARRVIEALRALRDARQQAG